MIVGEKERLSHLDFSNFITIGSVSAPSVSRVFFRLIAGKCEGTIGGLQSPGFEVVLDDHRHAVPS